MLARHKVVAGATGLGLVLSLSACQQRVTEGFDVHSNGSVTVSQVSTVILDLPSANVKITKPDLAKLLKQAKAGTSAYVGSGVAKPVVTLQQVGSRTFVLKVSQTMASAALVNKHLGQLNGADLMIDSQPTVPAPPSETDPFGLKVPHTESLQVSASDPSDSGDSGDSSASNGPSSLWLKHSGHQWSVRLSESAKNFAADKADAAQAVKEAASVGISPSQVQVEVHVRLPGRITSTNGKQLGGGIVSWNLLDPKSPTLWANSTS